MAPSADILAECERILVRQADPDIQMATTIRRALLSIVSAIEKRYDLPDSRERSNYCNKRKEGV